MLWFYAHESGAIGNFGRTSYGRWYEERSVPVASSHCVKCSLGLCGVLTNPILPFPIELGNLINRNSHIYLKLIALSVPSAPI